MHNISAIQNDVVHVLSIFMQPQNKKLPCCLYLAALAVTDNLFIIICLELSLMMGFFPDYFTDAHCKFIAYHFQASKFFKN